MPCGGGWLGVHLGPGAFVRALLASFGALLALFFLRERSPLNRALLYTFASGEGLTLGLLLQRYVAHGLGAS
jgi:FtsH-binding integral membrane protein